MTVIVGEILFDHFPDGSRVIGGAPMNVAVHLQAFGESPLLISRVGRDAAGDEAEAWLANHGLQTWGIQRDDDHPTGTVRVALDDTGSPRFDIVADQAYDYIDAHAAREAVYAAGDERHGLGHERLLYHGTLAARSPGSRGAIHALREALPGRIFVDANLRPPWTNGDVIADLCRRVAWLKLNEDEAPANVGPIDESVGARLRTSGVGHLLLTRGADGAMLTQPDDTRIREPSPPVAQLVDTVGAGDAFAAVAILGILRGWSLPLMMRRAVQFAAAVCGIRGAVPTDPDFWSPFRAAWSD